MAKFKPGESGNPAGRPRGTPNKTTKLRRAIEDRLPGIADKLIEAAEAGDVAAASLLFSRAIPALKPVDTPVPVVLGDNPAQAGRGILAALADGSSARRTAISGRPSGCARPTLKPSRCGIQAQGAVSTGPP